MSATDPTATARQHLADLGRELDTITATAKVSIDGALQSLAGYDRHVAVLKYELERQRALAKKRADAAQVDSALSTTPNRKSK